MKRYILVLMSVLTIALIPAWTHQTIQGNYTRAIDVRVTAASVQGVEVAISQPTVKSDYGLGVSILGFQAVDKSAGYYSGLRFGAYYQDSAGEIIGSDIFPAGVTVTGKAQMISIPVARIFAPGTRVIVMVTHASNANGDITVAGRDVKDALALNQPHLVIQPRSDAVDFLQNPDKKSSSFRLGKDNLCDPGFCANCISSAQDVCNLGVKTYSCSIQSCTCSFTCK